MLIVNVPLLAYIDPFFTHSEKIALLEEKKKSEDTRNNGTK